MLVLTAGVLFCPGICRRVLRAGVRLRDSAGGPVLGRLEHARADRRRAGGELPQPQGVPDAHQDDGIVQAGRRGAPAHSARVRLERGRAVVLQHGRELRAGQLGVSLHFVGRVHSAGPQARLREFQRHRRLRHLQETAHHPVG